MSTGLWCTISYFLVIRFGLGGNKVTDWLICSSVPHVVWRQQVVLLPHGIRLAPLAFIVTRRLSSRQTTTRHDSEACGEARGIGGRRVVPRCCRGQSPRFCETCTYRSPPTPHTEELWLVAWKTRRNETPVQLFIPTDNCNITSEYLSHSSSYMFPCSLSHTDPLRQGRNGSVAILQTVKTPPHKPCNIDIFQLLKWRADGLPRVKNVQTKLFYHLILKTYCESS